MDSVGVHVLFGGAWVCGGVGISLSFLFASALAVLSSSEGSCNTSSDQ